MDTLWSKICQASRNANVLGLNFPMVKDPKTQVGSVSLTILVLATTFVAVGLIGKWSGYLLIDMNHAFNLFYTSVALYFGRKLTTKGDNTVETTDAPVIPGAPAPKE